MSNRKKPPSPFVDELGNRVEVSITFPVLRFPMWRVAVWRLKTEPVEDRAWALSFYPLDESVGRIPRCLFNVALLIDEGPTALSPLWHRYPGMRLAIGLQLLMFHELPAGLERDVKEFTLQELEARNPHLLKRLFEPALH